MVDEDGKDDLGEATPRDQEMMEIKTEIAEPSTQAVQNPERHSYQPSEARAKELNGADEGYVDGIEKVAKKEGVSFGVAESYMSSWSSLKRMKADDFSIESERGSYMAELGAELDASGLSPVDGAKSMAAEGDQHRTLYYLEKSSLPLSQKTLILADCFEAKAKELEETIKDKSNNDWEETSDEDWEHYLRQDILSFRNKAQELRGQSVEEQTGKF